ncbi:MAG TPA: hypothetical protein VGH19_17685 [Verrucomicrobiae bacterium]
MARNRKNEAAGVRFGPAIKAVLLCLFIAAAAIGFVWQQSQIGALGKEMKERETKLAELKRQNQLRNDQLRWMRSPQVIDARVRELQLGLVPVQPAQVVRMVELPYETGQVTMERPVASTVKGGPINP